MWFQLPGQVLTRLEDCLSAQRSSVSSDGILVDSGSEGVAGKRGKRGWWEIGRVKGFQMLLQQNMEDIPRLVSRKKQW